MSGMDPGTCCRIWGGLSWQQGVMSQWCHWLAVGPWAATCIIWFFCLPERAKNKDNQMYWALTMCQTLSVLFSLRVLLHLILTINLWSNIVWPLMDGETEAPCGEVTYPRPHGQEKWSQSHTQIQQTHSCLRAFALAFPSVGSFFPLDFPTAGPFSSSRLRWPPLVRVFLSLWLNLPLTPLITLSYFFS